MTLGPRQLVLCSGTLPRLTPFAERLTVASAAGFDAISLWGRDYEQAERDGLSPADMASATADHGLVVAEVDPAWWWTPGAEGFSIPRALDPLDVFCFGEKALFELAESVGARSVNAADVLGGTWTPEEGAEAFARLCDRAAEHGLLVHLEWLVWSRIPDLESARRIVELADRPNGGITVDAWHCARAGVTAADLRALPGARVLSIQLDDGPALPEADLVHATLHDRLLPGEGEFDIAGYLGALRDIGAVAPVGVEVFSDALHEAGAAQAAQRAATATRAALAAVDWEVG
jgi:sugar phosphate isomerase/epimerase